ncbi:uncharacterized protein K452DRAFT_73532 [Aplosporella prunicola CBS 121167]|uniref:Carboxymuconolactone decarboxylase-like domain-containing protein n=1 Tax=Aplosporella prunicola CBS 121167 TaxID=1176127 RepID=A0A6A6B5R6_9PEZI|nr:uncharacterized protein K452DRAFT_73532 [Aplosporella prunicola CBS 121167]KAF2139206.1 hypothetical protein K452DRAFT_73532 [Aplosporella prunicola CBS 121167]
MRLPYAPPTPPPTAPPSTHDTYARIRERRHPRPLIPLDLALLHSPPLADGYNAFIGAIRSATTVPPELLELAIARVGALTGAAWEWRAHSALAAKAGVRRRVLAWVLKGEEVREDVVMGVGEEGEEKERGDGVEDGEARVLTSVQAAVLRYADAMERGAGRVGSDVFEALKGFFDDRAVVELTVAVAAYCAVSRILVALDVGEMEGVPLELPAEAV